MSLDMYPQDMRDDHYRDHPVQRRRVGASVLKLEEIGEVSFANLSPAKEVARFLAAKPLRLTVMQRFILGAYLMDEKTPAQILSLVKKRTVETVSLQDVELALNIAILALSEEGEQVH